LATEIGDPHGALAIEQQIGRLDVAVQDAELVRVRQGLRGLYADAGHAAVVFGRRSAGEGALVAGRPSVRSSAGLVSLFVGGEIRRGKLAGDQAVGHTAGELAPRRVRGGHGRPAPAEVPYFAENLVQSLAIDVLHRIVIESILLADAKDLDDVGVMELGRRLGLAQEAFLERRLQQAGEREHFEGHTPAERLLHGLVHHAHAAAANLAQNAVLAQALWDGRSGGTRFCQFRSGLLHGYQSGQEFADLVGQFGIALDVLAHGRTLAGPIALQEGLRDLVEGVAVLVGTVHRYSSPSPPGMAERISLSRCNART
jgi:hypothetical protein